MQPLSEDERFIMDHISMFGIDAYPIRKLGKRGWVWGPMRGIAGPPIVFKTKREAIASFDRYLDSLRDRLGAIAQAEAIERLKAVSL